MTKYYCENCNFEYPQYFVYKCPECGGNFTNILLEYKKTLIGNHEGIWKYINSFGLPDGAPIISLGEGNTPLIKVDSTNIFLKAEYQNPTGSFKDRLIAPIISLLSSFGIKEAVEDSSGNAGAAFAAYSAKAGIKGKVFVPSYASGPKREQIERYGAELVAIEGTRRDTTIAIHKYLLREKAIYASHAHIPHGVAGVATIAYEVFEQMNDVPDVVVCPVGHASLLVGMALGFRSLLEAGLTTKTPKIVGVQSDLFSPFFNKLNAINNPIYKKTIAEGASVLKPIFSKWVIDNFIEFNIEIVITIENSILNARDELARMGFYVEKTSAIIWPIIQQISKRNNKLKIVGILTGSGLKD